MPETTRLELRYPEGTDAPDVPADLQRLADDVDGKAVEFGQGLINNRPTVGTQGRFYWATNESKLYYDDGSAWRQVTYDPVTDAAAATGSLRTLGTGARQAAAGNDSRFTSGVAAESITLTELADELVPSRGASTSAEAVRALGSASGQAAPGNDSRLSNERVPTDGSVTAAKIAANAVTAAKIANNAVGASELQAGSVGSSEIASGAVGSSELASDSVTAAKVVDGSITSSKLATGSVTSAKIASGVVPDIVSLTQAEYDALTPVDTTIYLITA